MKAGKVFALIGLIMLAGQAYAGKTYFGFDLGGLSFDQAVSVLKKRGAIFDPNYGYKGDTSLPSIKVTGDPIIGKYGELSEGWLSFGPDKRLYEISASWRNGAETFKVLHDALDGKYPHAQGGCKKWGFDTNCYWKDQNGKVKIHLHRNDFGFQSTTTLTYTWRPALGAVATQKARIEENIRMQNAKKAASDI